VEFAGAIIANATLKRLKRGQSKKKTFAPYTLSKRERTECLFVGDGSNGIAIARKDVDFKRKPPDIMVE